MPKVSQGPELVAIMVTQTWKGEIHPEVEWALKTVQITKIDEVAKQILSGARYRTVITKRYELRTKVSVDRFRQVQEKIAARLTHKSPVIGVYVQRKYGAKQYQGLYTWDSEATATNRDGSFFKVIKGATL